MMKPYKGQKTCMVNLTKFLDMDHIKKACRNKEDTGGSRPGATRWSKNKQKSLGVSNHWNGIRTGLDWTGMEQYGIVK